MKINSIKLSALHNEEHLGFNTEANQIMGRYDRTAIDIPEDKYTRHTAAVANEDLSYKIVVKSAQTKIMNALDIVRDKTVTGLMAQVRALLDHYDTALQAAADRVMIEIEAFGNMRKKNYVAETTDIINLLQSLHGKLAPDVTLLQLAGWVAKLEADNNAFIASYDDRHSEQADKDSLTRLRTCRLETDASYRDIINRVNAGIVFNGEAKYKTFVDDISVTINYYNNIIAQRQGRAAAANNNDDDDTPDDTNNPQTPPTNPPPRDEE